MVIINMEKNKEGVQVAGLMKEVRAWTLLVPGGTVF